MMEFGARHRITMYIYEVCLKNYTRGKVKKHCKQLIFICFINREIAKVHASVIQQEQLDFRQQGHFQ